MTFTRLEFTTQDHPNPERAAEIKAARTKTTAKQAFAERQHQRYEAYLNRHQP